MNVLVLRPDHIGDMLLTTPFLASLRKSFPEWHIAVLCGSWSESILNHNPNYNEIILCDYPWLARSKPALWRLFVNTVKQMRAQHYELVINLRKAAKASAIARYINGKQIWGFDVGKSSWAHTHTIKYRTDIHIADLYCEFSRALGGIIKHTGLQLFFNENEIAEYENNVKLPARYAVIAPGAGYPEKLWKTDYWSRTADRIFERCGLDIVLIGSEGESGMTDTIRSSMKNPAHDVAGKLSVRSAAYVIKKAVFVNAVEELCNEEKIT